MDYNKIMQDLAEYTMIKESTETMIENLKDQLKDYMTSEGLETLIGTEHKAIYKQVTSNRIDTKALKNDLPDIAKTYTKPSVAMKFMFT